MWPQIRGRPWNPCRPQSSDWSSTWLHNFLKPTNINITYLQAAKISTTAWIKHLHFPTHKGHPQINRKPRQDTAADQGKFWITTMIHEWMNQFEHRRGWLLGMFLVMEKFHSDYTHVSQGNSKLSIILHPQYDIYPSNFRIVHNISQELTVLTRPLLCSVCSSTVTSQGWCSTTRWFPKMSKASSLSRPNAPIWWFRAGIWLFSVKLGPGSLLQWIWNNYHDSMCIVLKYSVLQLQMQKIKCYIFLHQIL